MNNPVVFLYPHKRVMEDYPVSKDIDIDKISQEETNIFGVRFFDKRDESKPVSIATWWMN